MSTATQSKANSKTTTKKVDYNKPHLVQVQEGLYQPDGNIKPRIDKEKGIVYDVKVLGNSSKNGRFYPPSIVMEAKDLYEGARVNIDHPAPGENAGRNYQSGIGVLRGVYEQQGELFAKEFHYNTKHPAANQLEWDVENAPNSLGFSHNAMVLEEFKEGKLIVRKIQKVKSVDLVSTPATTKGIFESENSMDAMSGGMGTDAMGGSMPVQEDDDILNMLLNKIKEIYSGNGDPAAKAKAIGAAAKAVLKVSDELEKVAVTPGAGEGEGSGTTPTSGEGGSGGEMNTEESLKKTIAEREAEIKGLKNKEKARQLFKEAKILDPTDEQLTAVSVLESEDSQKKLVATWKPGDAAQQNGTTKPGTNGVKPRSSSVNALESQGNDAATKKVEEEKFDPLKLASTIRK